jgi:hypothetical protein
MSITKGQFRWLVTASVVITILGLVVSFAGESSLPAPLRDYLALESRSEADLTASDVALVVVGIPLLVALVVSIIGLYCFWRFARPLTVIAWIVGLILQVFVGPTVDSGLATSLYELAAILTGIILAVIYITPAKAWFEKTHDT